MRILMFSGFMIWFAGAYGQLPPSTDHYMLNPVLINPAFTGGRDVLNISALYRRQWTGIKGAPETIMLTADAPFYDNKIGIGMSLIHDKIGVTRSNNVSLMYSYHIINRNNDFSFGLKAGLLTTNTVWSELAVKDPGDEAFLTDSRVFVMPDVSFGIYYSAARYFAGWSVPRLVSYRFNYERNRYSMIMKPVWYSYLLNGGYLFKIARDFNFIPSVLVSLSPRYRTLIDVNALFSFSDKLWTGVSYRSNRSVAGIFQLGITRQIKTAYTYLFDFGSLRRFSYGSHEIMLRYEFRYKAEAVNPLIF